MNRLDRLTSILIQLQSKRLTTAREIAKRFEVTNRTIYRDIQTLRLAGVPIGEELLQHPVRARCVMQPRIERAAPGQGPFADVGVSRLAPGDQ